MRARDNPFRTERLLQVVYQLQGVAWPELLLRAENLRYRAALIGPCGSGKTTLLETLEPRLRDQGFGTRFICLDKERPSFDNEFLANLFAELTSRDIILCDGAEQMTPPAWYWFRWRARKSAGLIITTHRSGRLPTLWECRTSPELLAKIAGHLLDVEHDEVQECAKDLFQKHGGNLRKALREWYDLIACQPMMTPNLPLRRY